MGRPTQNQEIWHSKWRIAQEKSVYKGFYQNLEYIYPKLFTTLQPLAISLRELIKFWKKKKKTTKMAKNTGIMPYIEQLDPYNRATLTVNHTYMH